ncbi:MAG: hypothetical protein EOO65_01035 [Methanosarcinales archaeon]|nr:MAG: hypothetical protein EOO65_01035 [Methanosarcinales archaeon]
MPSPSSRPSFVVAPTVAAGSTVVSFIVRLSNVNVPCSVLVHDMLFVSLIRISFSSSLNVSVDRVHASVMVDNSCFTVLSPGRHSAPSNRFPVDINVRVVTSPVSSDSTTLNATATTSSINSTPMAVMLRTFLGWSCTLHYCFPHCSSLHCLRRFYFT